MSKALSPDDQRRLYSIRMNAPVHRILPDEMHRYIVTIIDDKYIRQCLMTLYLISTKFMRGKGIYDSRVSRLPAYDSKKTFIEKDVSRLLDNTGSLLDEEDTDRMIAITYYVALVHNPSKSNTYQLRKGDRCYVILGDNNHYVIVGRIHTYRTRREVLDNTTPICSMEDMDPSSELLSLKKVSRDERLIKKAEPKYQNFIRNCLQPGKDPRVPEPIPIMFEKAVLRNRMYNVIERFLELIPSTACDEQRYKVLPPSINGTSFKTDIDFIFQ